MIESHATHHQLQPLSAMLAIVRLQIRLVATSWTASLPAFPFRLVNHRCRDDASGNRNDGIAEDHDKTGEEPADHGHWGDVAIAYRGQRDYCPVDACWYAGELCAGFVALHHEHQRAYDGDEHYDEKEINQYLVHALADALYEQVALVDEGKKLEHPEDANESERSHQRHIAQRRIDNAEYLWQGGKQVNDAEETENVFALVWRTIHTQSVLQCEEEAQHIF